MKKKEYSIEVDGKTLKAEFNDLADQANGAVMLRYGNTVVLATAVMGSLQDGDFFPLTVDYEERFYAAGKILGSKYSRREGRPSTEAILAGRIVDRTVRPLFNHRMRNQVQIVVTTISIGEEKPDVVSVIAASLALGISDIPWNGPVSAVRIDNKTDLELVACGKDGLINMIEVGSKEVGEEVLNEGLRKASAEIEKIQEWQNKIIKEIGREKSKVELSEVTPGTIELFKAEIAPKLAKCVFSNEPGHGKINELKEMWTKLFSEKLPEGNMPLAQEIFEEAVNEVLHIGALENNLRADGRKMDEVRPLYAQAGGISPILHGSGIFYRGGTHVMSVLTLAAPGDALVLESLTTTPNQHFIHHYNFPPFSAGETGKIGGTNRRMIGHGALAEKALLPVIPAQDKFPYTIRLVSEALASNGSTSMGSVCGSTLALMDGGIPITAPVAGIASGLMMKNENEYKILTDIQGPEDQHGDMDFKVAGTRRGITAAQMDVKVSGIPLKILSLALESAKKARLQILDVMEKEIAAPRSKISPHAPEIVTMRIEQSQIGHIIGPGGKTINEIRAKTGVEDILIEDDGSVFITGKNGTAEKARLVILSLTSERPLRPPRV